MTQMKVLTTLEPYASALVYGAKTGENRGRRLNYTGELLIHAGLSRELLPHIGQLRFQLGQVVRCFEDWWIDRTLGCIIGMVKVHRPVRGEDCGDNPWAAWGQWYHPVTEARVFRNPIPCRGQQMLFDVPHDLVDRVVAECDSAMTPDEALNHWQHEHDKKFLTREIITDHGRFTCD